MRETFFFSSNSHHVHFAVLTLLEPQSRFGDKPFKFQVVCPQYGTAVLTGLRLNLKDMVVTRRVEFYCQMLRTIKAILNHKIRTCKGTSGR